MSRIIIACATLRRELLSAMEANNCTDPVVWLRAGAHNVPQKRLEEIQSALEKCDGYDTVLLCMTICGNSLVGLKSGRHTLVLPRSDDCLSLISGGGKRPTDSYYLNEGWLQGDENILNEYDAAVRKYGKTRADRIFFAMLKNYRRLVWLGHCPVPERVRAFANHFSLELVKEKSDLTLFHNFLREKWNNNFLVIPPDSEITLEMRNGGNSNA